MPNRTVISGLSGADMIRCDTYSGIPPTPDTRPSIPLHHAPEGTSIVTLDPHEICAAFFTPGKLTDYRYDYLTESTGVITGTPIPGYTSCSIPEIDALATYHGCLGRIADYIEEDLLISFACVCTGFIIGEGRDIDTPRLLPVIRSLNYLMHWAIGVGNYILLRLSVSCYIILEITLMPIGPLGCIRTLCYRERTIDIIRATYPSEDATLPRQCLITARQTRSTVLNHRLAETQTCERKMCSQCSQNRCPLRGWYGTHTEEILPNEAKKNSTIKPLTAEELASLKPYFEAYQKAGLLDTDNRFINKRGQTNKHAFWIVEMLRDHFPEIEATRLAAHIGKPLILTERCRAEADEKVALFIQGIIPGANSADA